MKYYSKHFFAWVLLCALSQMSWAQIPDLEVSKIYSSDNHDAFTSLIKFNGSYYCAFRTGEHHVYGKDGTSMIIRSKDASKWKKHAELTKDGIDLRDPKLSITPDGRIMALVGGSHYEGKELLGMHTQVFFSDKKGKKFSDPVPIVVDPKVKTDFDWLWSVTWYNDMAYGVLYQRGAKSSKLVKSDDGIHYSLVCDLGLDGRPNEAGIQFSEDGTAYILHRREEGNQKGYWGSSKAPYNDWQWKELDLRLGGPAFTILSEDQVFAGTRIYGEEDRKVGILKGSLKGDFNIHHLLPSGGDCSYPSFLVEPDRILMSYYSSHESTADIYLATWPR